MKPGKRRRTGERHAQIPVAVMRSAAWHACPLYARLVLLALAAGFRGINNGSLSLTVREANECAINRWRLYAGLHLLQDTGLIICTRKAGGISAKRHVSLYALTWRPIQDCTYPHGYDPGITPESKPRDTWRDWIAPPDWPRHEQRIRARVQGVEPRNRESAARMRAKQSRASDTHAKRATRDRRH